ncbi:MAG: S41 family peptidase [Phycisphaerales bacterium]
MNTRQVWRRMAGVVSLAVISCAALAWQAVASPRSAQAQEPPAPIISLDFDANAIGSPPLGLTVTTPTYKAEVVDDNAGGRCVKVTRTGEGDTGVLLAFLDATPHRGHNVTLKATVRTSEGTRAGLWLRVDRQNDTQGFFDNMADRLITSSTWGEHEITGDIAPDATSIVYGLLVFGPGPVWLDSLTITDAGKAEAREPDVAPLTERGRDNIVALTRLVGVLRSFSPTTESRGVNWDTYTIDAVNAVEPCKNADELVAALKAWTLPIAPGVQFWRGQRDQGPPESPRPENATGAVAMVHQGFADPGLDPSQRRMNIYSSEQVRIDLNAQATDSRPAPGETATLSLGGDVFARVPIAPYVNADRTLPEATTELPKPAHERSKSWRPTPAERAVRFAVLIEAWNTLNHFYPYFDVSETDWVAALPPALEKAATDPTPEQFWRTLATMHAKIKDGHGWVGGPGQFTVMPHPYSSEWVGDEIVIRRVADNVADRLSPGDVVEAIDGASVRDLYQTLEPTICAASEQWTRHRALSQIGWGPGKNDVTLSIKRGSSSLEVSIPRGPYKEPAMQRPENGSELSPGIVYFNLDATNLATFSANLPKLAAAKGIVFDLRGYPADAGSAILPYLSDTNIKSAQWRVPIIARPNYQRVRFKASNWDLPPQNPRLTSNVAFLTDGRAISYAESCMGIVEAYKLGEIVGSATAGSNGNITTAQLPCGYSVTWTGMQVLKHDGSRHHGVGIRPTVPVAPTKEGLAAGRDEVLEKAVEVVKAKLVN